MAAKESRASGVAWHFAPMVDIARDARWGRVSEGPGEDPYLASEFAKAKIRGLQNDRSDHMNYVAACLKHYVGYGAASGGRGGSEVVQIYVRDRIASVTRLVRELKGYVRVELKPGESRRVAVEVPFSAFAFHCDGKLVAGKGSFDAWIASDSASGRQIGFELHLSREDFLQHKKGER